MRVFLLMLGLVFTIETGAQVLAVREGDVAPEISMTALDGKILKLSDYKGQLVLIDFWASWCGPCRKESPFLVDVYKEYSATEFKNGNGFTIFSVSMDMQSGAWKKAVEDDGLFWSSHVSDLKGWRNEAAKLYGVKGIPGNVLIDGSGVVLAVNLRGAELESALKKQKKSRWCFWCD